MDWIKGPSRRSLRTWLGAFGLFGAGTRNAEADALSDGRFRTEVVNILKQARPHLAVTLPADRATLHIGERVLGLDNLFRHVQTVPAAERDREVLRFVDIVLTDVASAPTSFAALAPMLRLARVPAAYATLAAPEAAIVHRPWFADVLVAVAIDRPDRLEYVTQQHHADMQAVPLEKLFDTALDNLEATAQSIVLEAVPAGSGPGRFLVNAERDGYDAPRLLAPRFMARVRAALGSDHCIVGIPNRDFLVAWMPDDSSRVDFASQVMHGVGDKLHPVTGELFVSEASGVHTMTAAKRRDHGQSA